MSQDEEFWRQFVEEDSFEEARASSPLARGFGESTHGAVHIDHIDNDEFEARYTVHEIIGHGRCGPVHRVISRRSGAELACKTVEKERAGRDLIWEAEGTRPRRAHQ